MIILRRTKGWTRHTFWQGWNIAVPKFLHLKIIQANIELKKNVGTGSLAVWYKLHPALCGTEQLETQDLMLLALLPCPFWGLWGSSLVCFLLQFWFDSGTIFSFFAPLFTCLQVSRQKAPGLDSSVPSDVSVEDYPKLALAETWLSLAEHKFPSPCHCGDNLPTSQGWFNFLKSTTSSKLSPTCCFPGFINEGMWVFY